MGMLHKTILHSWFFAELCGSWLFSSYLQVLRNADVDCALAEISLTNSNLNEIAEQQNGRNVNLFNLMGMRMVSSLLQLLLYCN